MNGERISNGIQANTGDFPFIVSVTINGQHLCGGFIYNKDWVVTSASCVYGYLNDNIYDACSRNSFWVLQ